ncbi:hypothetical protein XCR1_840076 [Xenorhabdus cabanillasii JM26]|uniref:Uncharacterized protein n=1 Tax=Xenorhabdus cabanillasii JM26 TaxID=1427517 RepID=W1JB42_9GAMM|nr:hypothetical protein XCR1_840076 [Xenorhabdus cabanillasii JM26]
MKDECGKAPQRAIEDTRTDKQRRREGNPYETRQDFNLHHRR